MKEVRYNIDLKETTKPGKFLRIVLGIICLVATIWFLFTIRGTTASITTAWIAIAFLFIFALWMIGSGLGVTDRYVTVGENRITLRQNFLKPPVVFTSSTLEYVQFLPLSLEFHTNTGKVTLRLGTYYPEHTAGIIEAVEKFCASNGIKIQGLEPEDKNIQS